jgi:hypothetical protein
MNSIRSKLSAAAAFLGWALVFAVAYAQSPLYTSNQDQYFLHGLACAGVGHLNQDWLARTLDPLPVFSGLVCLTQRVFQSGLPYYFYYALLMGVYLFSLFGIMDILFNLHLSKTRALVFMALFMVFHSAALRFLLSRIVDTDSTFLFEGGVAGQRLLGQVLQPSVFGVFLLLSIYLFLRGRHGWAILPLAVAVYFHSTYLLSAALLTLAYMGVLWQQEGGWKKPLQLGLLTLVVVLPVVVYTFLVFRPTSPTLYQTAQAILVNIRIPPHTKLSDWLNWTVMVQAAIVLLAGYQLRRTRLFPIYLVLFTGTLVLTALQLLTGSNTLALIFPWRVSVLLVPMGTSTLLAWAVTRNWPSLANTLRNGRLLRSASLLLVAVLMAVGVARFEIESARQTSDPAHAMMAFVAAHPSSGAVYLIPTSLQDFRLATGEPIYVDFKSIPYLDTDVIEWNRRLNKAIIFYYDSGHPNCNSLAGLGDEGVNRVVLPSGNPSASCSGLTLLYQDQNYSLYSYLP